MAKKRARTARREDARAAGRLLRAKEALAVLEPGGTAERPIEVESASQIEVHARSMTCPACGEPWHVEEHVVEVHDGRTIRVVRARSPQCGRRRRIYFAIVPALAN
jgi:hypothetical protein